MKEHSNIWAYMWCVCGGGVILIETDTESLAWSQQVLRRFTQVKPSVRFRNIYQKIFGYYSEFMSEIQVSRCFENIIIILFLQCVCACVQELTYKYVCNMESKGCWALGTTHIFILFSYISIFIYRISLKIQESFSNKSSSSPINTYWLYFNVQSPAIHLYISLFKVAITKYPKQRYL